MIALLRGAVLLLIFSTVAKVQNTGSYPKPLLWMGQKPRSKSRENNPKNKKPRITAGLCVWVRE